MTKRIPTILALFVLGLAVTLTVLATRSVQTLFTKAATGTTPKNIRVTNIADTSFTVSYLTDTAVKGSAGIEGQTFFPDDRDGDVSKAKPYYTHYISIKNLQPGTLYRYLVENGTTTYEVTTAPAITSAATTAEPIYGTVTKSDGSAAIGAIIYFSPFGGSPVSTYVKANGNFLLPVNNIRTTDLKSYLFLKPNDPETIFIEGAKDGVSTVSCVVGKDKPIPNVTLGKDVNCSTTPVAQTAQSATTTVSAVTITSPTEGEILSTGLPTFRGKAPINKVLQIEVRPTTVTGSVKADAAGNWVWPVTTSLNSGQHSLTITYLESTGTTKTIARNFSVKAAGAGTAILPQTFGTPSATIKTTPTPTPTPKPTIVKPPVTGETENLIILLTAGMFLVTLGLSTIYKAVWIR